MSSSSSSESEEEEQPVKGKKRPATSDAKKKKRIYNSFGKDEDYPKLTVPKVTLDEDYEAEQGKKVAEVRYKQYNKERKAEEDAIKEADPDEFDEDIAIGYESEEDAEQVWKRAQQGCPREDDPLFAFDPKTGKTTLAREPVIKALPNYQIFPGDGTFVFCGIRRSGKTWAVRDMMYHMRGQFSKGIVFSATAHNGNNSVLYHDSLTSTQASGASTSPLPTSTRSSMAM